MALLRTQEGIFPPNDHVVHFYELESELVGAVAPYLSAGIQAGETTIVIAGEAHRQAFRAELDAGGDIDLAQLSREGRFIELDAATTMAAFTVEGQIERVAFHNAIGDLFRKVAKSGRAVRAYGEMVALLWDAGEVLAAIELETWWNELAHELPFSLFCSYAAASVSESGHAEALHRICHLHSSVVHPCAEDDQGERSPFDGLSLTAEFEAERDAPGQARRMLIAALRLEGYAETLVQDAALVLTELATNAVLHAQSPFSVSISSEDSMLRIAVTDRDQLTAGHLGEGLVSPPGRGIGLIDAISTRWGTKSHSSGKTVWAELVL
jgi:MEDS: MEthanogen/methylotroph, DcmR Sensory domain/Histidine kinase-like ATPase domain